MVMQSWGSRLVEIVEIDGMQLGKAKKQQKHYQEKMLVKNTKLYCAFVDLENAFNRVPRQLCCRWKRGVAEQFVRLVEEIYLLQQSNNKSENRLGRNDRNCM